MTTESTFTVADLGAPGEPIAVALGPEGIPRPGAEIRMVTIIGHHADDWVSDCGIRWARGR